MFGEFFDTLFGCRHKHYGFPISEKKGSSNRSRAACVTGTYVVCLDCGREFPYDWNQMKIVPFGSEAPAMPPLTAEPVVTGFGKIA